MTSNTPETQALLPVTQVDRDAAEAFCQLNMLTGPTWRERVAQLLARHRQSISNAASVGVTGDYVAIEPRQMGDGDPYWMVEIQASGGYHSVAEIYSGTAEDARLKACLAISAWSGCGNDPTRELIAMLNAGDVQEGCRIFDHTPEEIGLHVMENHAAILASLSTPTAEPVGSLFERDDECNVEFGTVPDCDCPHEHWHVGGNCLDVHVEEDGTGHAIFGNDDWQLGVSGIVGLDEMREIAFAWALHKMALTTPPTPDRIGKHEGFAPCPTCKQYSHSIGDDALAKAFMHFEAMTAHPVRGHPMGHVYDEATRDAAQVLIAAAKGRIGKDAVREALVELVRKTRIQATCLEQYAEQSGFSAKPIPSVFHSQAVHFRTFADEADSALSATPAQEGGR